MFKSTEDYNMKNWKDCLKAQGRPQKSLITGSRRLDPTVRSPESHLARNQSHIARNLVMSPDILSHVVQNFIMRKKILNMLKR